MRGGLALVVVAAALAIGGCHRESATVPLLAIGPIRAGDPQLYDDAVRAARDAGHAAIRVDPEHGRFAVRADADPGRQTVIVIQCSRDGYVTITPQGAHVERVGDAFVVPTAVRNEVAQLAIAMERLIPEAR